MQDYKQKVVQGFAWEAVTRVIVQIASWVSTIWVARILTPSDYGIVGISGIFTGLSIAVAGMGLAQALVNRQNLEQQDLSNAFWMCMILSLAFYGLLFVLAPWIAGAYNIPELTHVVQVAGLMVVISAIGIVPRALIMREMRFKLAALIRMFSMLLVTVSALFLAFAGWGYWALVVSTILGEAFLVVVFGFFVRFVPTKPQDLQSSVSMLKYGGNIVSGNLVSSLNAKWPAIYASRFLGKEPTGYLQMAETLAGLPMTKIGEIFNRVAFPSFSRIQDDRERTKKVFLRLHRMLFMITVPIFMGFALLAEELVAVLLGEKWLPIVVPVQILCVLNIFRISAQIIPPLLLGVGNSRAPRNYQIVLLPLMAVSLYVGAQWSLEWMLVAWLLSFPLAYAYLLVVTYKELTITLVEILKSMAPALISGGLMISSLAALHFSGFLNAYSLYAAAAMKVVGGATVYIVVYFVCDRAHLQEVLDLGKLLLKKQKT